MVSSHIRIPAFNELKKKNLPQVHRISFFFLILRKVCLRKVLF